MSDETSKPDHQQIVREEEAALEREVVIDFPCVFPIKIMGPSDQVFIDEIKALVDQHVPGLTEAAWKHRPSAKGNFVGLTVTFEATSREQLDNLYRAITAHPDVKMCI